jgi:hypothetical protein
MVILNSIGAVIFTSTIRLYNLRCNRILASQTFARKSQIYRYKNIVVQQNKILQISIIDYRLQIQKCLLTMSDIYF